MAVLVFGLTLACGASPDGPAESSAPSDALNVFSVCPPEPEFGNVSWPAARWPGALVSVADETGYLATFRIGSARGECDHCLGPYAEAELVHGQLWPDVPGVPPGRICHSGVGPVAAPLEKLRLKELSVVPAVWEQQAPSPWQPSLEIDLDGDGQADLEYVQRCDRVQSTGCNEHVCDRTCRGVRRVGDPESSVSFVECQGYIPDLRDCP
jgi:hypothetical protein